MQQGRARHLCSLLSDGPCKAFHCSAYTASIIASGDRRDECDATADRTPASNDSRMGAPGTQQCYRLAVAGQQMPQQARWAAQMTPTSQFKTVPASTLAVWHCSCYCAAQTPAGLPSERPHAALRSLPGQGRHICERRQNRWKHGALTSSRTVPTGPASASCMRHG
jgi:hypothetical protein